MPTQGDTAPEAATTLARGATIGRYIILTMVGRGGMGDVYAAYDPELDRKVAIKLLRGNSGDATASARLVREAQAIAKLSHPNVVVAYDVGTFGDRVFIAMEFVDGPTIGYWLNVKPRPWVDVLKVFVAAGRGLVAAHDKHLVHRDFKPDNVMLGGDGQVRVMDFGLARLVRAPGAAGAAGAIPANQAARQAVVAAAEQMEIDETRRASGDGRSDRPGGRDNELLNSALTVAGTLLGTPAYMAPEQFLGRDTDARCDQFSFCVAMYEALYGQRPFAGNSLFALMANVTQGIVAPAPAGRDVPSWIRNVLLRGLAVAPDQRWPSMQALLDELARKQEVAGHRRFAERAAAKLAGIWEVPSPEPEGPRSSAQAAIQRAFIATGKPYAATVFDNVSRVLDQYATDWAEMYVSACEATHLHREQSSEVLDLRMDALQAALEHLRALCAAFRVASPKVVENAVSAAGALPPIERCADVKLLRAVVKPPLDVVTQHLVDQLRGQLADLHTLTRVGRLSDAMSAIESLENGARQAAYPPLQAEAQLAIGVVHFQRGDGAAAVRAYEEALWTAELCRHEEISVEAAIRLVGAMADQSRFDLGQVWAKLGETTLKRIGGHHGMWGWLYNELAIAHSLQGRLPEALDLIRRAITAKEKAARVDVSDVAISIGNMGVYHADLGEQERAVACLQRAVQILEPSLGPDHPTTAITLSNYAEVLNQLRRFAEARQAAQRALVVFERETEPGSIYVRVALTALGIAFLDDGMVDEALPLLERAAADREAHDTSLTRLGQVHFALAQALSRSHRDPVRARQLAQRARDEYSRASKSPEIERARATIDHWLSDQAA